MKKLVKIEIDLKDTRKMCSEKKRLSEECNTCLSEIQQSVSDFLVGIEEKDTKQRAKMSDEWIMFLTNAEDKLNTSITHSEKETTQLNTNSKWILSIVLGVTFCLGAAVGIIYKEVTQKADRDEIMTKQELQMLFDLNKTYNEDQFIHNPQAKTDSTNYNWLVDKLFSGTMRGGN